MCVPQSLAGHRPISTGLEHFSVSLHKERARRQYGDRCGRSRSPSRSDGGDAVQAAEKCSSVFERFGVPVLQALISSMTREQWQRSARGLNPLDTAMNV